MAISGGWRGINKEELPKSVGHERSEVGEVCYVGKSHGRCGGGGARQDWWRVREAPPYIGHGAGQQSRRRESCNTREDSAQNGMWRLGRRGTNRIEQRRFNAALR